MSKIQLQVIFTLILQTIKIIFQFILIFESMTVSSTVAFWPQHRYCEAPWKTFSLCGSVCWLQGECQKQGTNFVCPFLQNCLHGKEAGTNNSTTLTFKIIILFSPPLFILFVSNLPAQVSLMNKICHHYRNGEKQIDPKKAEWRNI